jgi:zinc/manganese transport system substrate-binding protein
MAAGFLTGGLLAAVLLAMQGCGSSAARDPWGGTTKKRVLTSFTPMYCFTANVAGEFADVRCLMTSIGPHDFQPSIYEAKLLASADMFVVNGLGLEEFLDSLVRNAGNGRIKICSAADAIPDDEILMAPGVTHYHGDKLVTHKAGKDPHVWLGVDQAKRQVDAICNALIEIDPPHANAFRENATAYKSKLDKLKSDFADLKVQGGLVTFHDSFRYFCRSFHIEFAGTIRGIKGEDISPAELGRQAKEYRDKGVRFISIEPQYPRKLAESLRDSINQRDVKLVELDPLETGPSVEGNAYIGDKEHYVRQMRRNLENLRKAVAGP